MTLTPARSSRLKKLLADTKSLSMPDQNQQINHLVARLSLGEAQASNAILSCMDQSRNATLPHSIRADGCEAAVGTGDVNLHGNGLTSGPERPGFAGVGRVAVGTARQGYDLQLTR